MRVRSINMGKIAAQLFDSGDSKQKFSVFFLVFLLCSLATSSSQGESEKMKEIKKSSSVKVTVLNPMDLYPTKITESGLRNMGCSIVTKEEASIDALASELTGFSSASDAEPLKLLDSRALVEFNGLDGSKNKFVFRRFDSTTKTTSGFFNDEPIFVRGDIVNVILLWAKKNLEGDNRIESKCLFVKTVKNN